MGHQVSVHKHRDAFLQLRDIINLLEWLGLRVVIKTTRGGQECVHQLSLRRLQAGETTLWRGREGQRESHEAGASVA